MAQTRRVLLKWKHMGGQKYYFQPACSQCIAYTELTLQRFMKVSSQNQTDLEPWLDKTAYIYALFYFHTQRILCAFILHQMKIYTFSVLDQGAWEQLLEMTTPPSSPANQFRTILTKCYHSKPFPCCTTQQLESIVFVFDCKLAEWQYISPS